ncbi:MAG: hypothetical protein ACRC6E_03115, partial [Fusobacteriaceae bacterium]
MSLELTEEMKRKLRVIDEMSNMTIVFGVVDEERKTDGVFVYIYAIYNEYGTKNIPERAFFRSFLWNKKTILNKMTKNLFTAVVEGKIKQPITAYKRLGRYLRTGIYDSLMNGTWD